MFRIKRLAHPVLLTLAAAASLVSPAQAELTFRYDGGFSESERDKLKTWIVDVHAGVEDLVGPFPFDVEIRFKRTQSNQPVPWANTRRGRRQGITFNVNPSFSLEELKSDWTAAHELSHLILPFVGQRNSWFAEGFASFMQYQVMHGMGLLSEAGAKQRYMDKLRRSAARYSYPDRRFVETTPRLRAERNVSVMYWGGSVFFFRLDAALRSNADTNLMELLSEYLACCRTGRSELSDLVRELDRVAGNPVVSNELKQFRSIVGFPAYDAVPIGIIAKE